MEGGPLVRPSVAGGMSQQLEPKTSRFLRERPPSLSEILGEPVDTVRTGWGRARLGRDHQCPKTRRPCHFQSSKNAGCTPASSFFRNTSHERDNHSSQKRSFFRWESLVKVPLMHEVNRTRKSCHISLSSERFHGDSGSGSSLLQGVPCS